MRRLMRACILSSLACTGTGAHAVDLKARVSTTLGDVEIKLYADQAPRTVGNFVELARQGYYDGTTFHKVVAGHWIHGGAKASGGPGYCFDDEIVPELRHDRPGIVSMASDERDANGSQFLVTVAATPSLDGRQTVFGEVTKGLDVVTKIAAAKTAGTKPVEPVVVTKVVIEGDGAPSGPEKRRELAQAELEARAGKTVDTLLAGIGSTTGLGKLERAELDEARGRCADSQLVYKVDFARSKGAKLVVLGRATETSYEINQFQFSRGSAR